VLTYLACQRSLFTAMYTSLTLQPTCCHVLCRLIVQRYKQSKFTYYCTPRVVHNSLVLLLSHAHPESGYASVVLQTCSPRASVHTFEAVHFTSHAGCVASCWMPLNTWAPRTSAQSVRPLLHDVTVCRSAALGPLHCSVYQFTLYTCAAAGSSPAGSSSQATLNVQLRLNVERPTRSAGPSIMQRDPRCEKPPLVFITACVTMSGRQHHQPASGHKCFCAPAHG
jgi:hypothetical protein